VEGRQQRVIGVGAGDEASGVMQQWWHHRVSNWQIIDGGAPS
jgi:hypothetical protein